MPTSSLELNIRNARPEDFESLGKLYASTSATDDLDNFLFENVGPEVCRGRLWIDDVSRQIAKDQDSLLVLECSRTQEVIGLAWVGRIKHDPDAAPGNTPEMAGSSPKGLNTEEGKKLSAGKAKWQKELLTAYHELMCEWFNCSSFQRGPSISSLSSFGQGFMNSILHRLTNLKDWARCC